MLIVRGETELGWCENVGTNVNPRCVGGKEGRLESRD